MLLELLLQELPILTQLASNVQLTCVRHGLGLKVALDAVDRGFSEPIWMMIISFLPLYWGFK